MQAKSFLFRLQALTLSLMLSVVLSVMCSLMGKGKEKGRIVSCLCHETYSSTTFEPRNSIFVIS